MIDKLSTIVRLFMDKFSIRKRNIPMTKGLSITKIKENEKEMNKVMKKIEILWYQKN